MSEPGSLVSVSDIPQELDILPLFGTVIYPLTVVPLAVGHPTAVRLLDKPSGSPCLIGLVALRTEHQRSDLTQPEDCYLIGTVALVHRLLRLPDATLRVAVQGLERIQVGSFLSDEAPFRAEVQVLPDPVVENDQQVTDLAYTVAAQAQRLAERIPNFSEELRNRIRNERDPRHLSFLIAAATLVQHSVQVRQRVLELPTVYERLEQLNAILASDLGRLERIHPAPAPSRGSDVVPKSFLLASTGGMMHRPGRALALRWSATLGGECVAIEAVQMVGSRGFRLTGQRDDDVLDTAYVALSWVRSEAARLGLALDFYNQVDLHVHIPPGGADDPAAAGLALVTVLVSLLTERPVASHVALVGGITLHGQVLPVSHLSERALIARQSGVKTVIVAAGNAPDLTTLPEGMKADLHFVLVDHIDQALIAAL